MSQVARSKNSKHPKTLTGRHPEAASASCTKKKKKKTHELPRSSNIPATHQTVFSQVKITRNSSQSSDTDI